MERKGIKLLLCAIAKNENNYLKEWVDYYKQLGFDNIVLYDNNDVEGEKITDVLQEDIDSGFIILKDVRGKKGNIQYDSYTECYKTIANNYDWIYFTDIDEYLTLTVPSTLKEVLTATEYNNYNAISLCEVLVDDNNLIESKGNYSINRFKDSKLVRMPWIKSIIKTNLPIDKINFSGGPINKVMKCCNVKGEACTNTYKITNPAYSPMYKKHYKFKTLEEFIDKVRRGHPLNESQYLSVHTFFTLNQKTPEKLTYLKHRGISYE